jgi:phage tail sheath protein FI
MPVYLTPGVYVEEIERGPRPIEGVPTSTAAFLGETERGPLRPHLVTSFREYERWFGSVFQDGRYMPHAVNGFFENGGNLVYVSRIVGANATAALKAFGDFTVRAVGAGAWGRRVWVRIQDGTTKDSHGNSGFRLKLAYWTTPPAAPYDPFEPANRANLPRPQYQEDYDDLSVDPLSSDFFEKRLRDSTTNLPMSALAGIERTSGTTSKPPPNPVTGEFLDQNGVDDPNPVRSAADFVGDIAQARTELQGLRALELDAFREVALVYAPFPPDNQIDIFNAIIDHCEILRFRFATIDCDRPPTEPDTLDPRTTIRDTEYAGFYAPWIWISDPLTGARRVVPPGGHVLGVYARVDTERGVFKAPANEILRGALDVRHDIDDRKQEVMNPRGVNAIRRFPGRGIRVWGARTLSSNGLWKYVSVRRLFIFLERSIYEGTQWVVFEPNDDRLWARVKDTIRLFLRTQWREGALFGRTEDEAFFITCDRTTMTQDDILNGRLICEIGIAPVRPAEFVIFRVFQYTAEAQR